MAPWNHRDKGEYCERRFQGGDFFRALTTGIFNHIDDYMGTEGNATRLRKLFDEYARSLDKQNASKNGSTMRRTVRLLSDADVAGHQLLLEHIDALQLKRLIEVDDALVGEQKRGRGIVNLADDTEGILKQLRRERSPAEAQAWQFIAEMTNAERAEFMTLVELARGHIRVGDEREHAALLSTKTGRLNKAT